MTKGDERLTILTGVGAADVLYLAFNFPGPATVSDAAILPCFTIAQLETLCAWSSTRPRGFRHVLAHRYEETAEEVAELTQREAHEHHYRVYPTLDGKVILVVADGSDAWVADTVEEALAVLLVNEKALAACRT